MSPFTTFRLTVFLNSGQSVQTEVLDDITEAEDLAQTLLDKLSRERPRWVRFGNIVAFSGAISGIEVEAL